MVMLRVVILSVVMLSVVTLSVVASLAGLGWHGRATYYDLMGTFHKSLLFPQVSRLLVEKHLADWQFIDTHVMITTGQVTVTVFTKSGNIKGGSIIVLLTSCLTGLN